MSGAILDLVALVHGWAAAIQARHGVDPYLYLALTTVCAPPFYYSIYRLTKALATRDGRHLSVWSALFLAATALPYLYVLLFGRNMPWWIYLVLGALLAHALASLFGKLTGRRRRAKGARLISTRRARHRERPQPAQMPPCASGSTVSRLRLVGPE